MFKTLLRIASAILLCSSLYGKHHYFTTHEDMCDQNVSKTCLNTFESVRNLQIALNRNKALGLHIKEDGKWGEETKKAVMTFQEYYCLKRKDGWVGPETKAKLDEVSGYLNFPKDKRQKRVRLMKPRRTKGYATYAQFRRHVNLRRSYAVFKDKRLLKKANGHNTKLVVDVSEQRIRMYVGGRVALDAPCTTGAKRKFEPNTRTYRDKHTPYGTFRIKEKILDKRSTIFGKFYKNGRCIYKGDRRKYCGPCKGVVYKGASLKYWMRLTSSGIGLHASKYVKRHPGTNGCIRLPHDVARLIFKKVRKGTVVKVVP